MEAVTGIVRRGHGYRYAVRRPLRKAANVTSPLYSIYPGASRGFEAVSPIVARGVYLTR